MDYSAISHFAGIPAVIPAIFVVAGAVLISLILIAMIVWMQLLRSRISKLNAVIVGREKAAANVTTELAAQALLARHMALDLEELRKRVADHEQTVRADSPLWGASSVPVNLNWRGQILRLSRKGKSIPEIAQSLNVAQGEVELLLKVQDLSQKTPTEEK